MRKIILKYKKKQNNYNELGNIKKNDCTEKNNEIERKLNKSIRLIKRYGEIEDITLAVNQLKKMKRYIKSKKRKIISISNG